MTFKKGNTLIYFCNKRIVRAVKPEQKDLIKQFNDDPKFFESELNGKPLNVKAEPKKKAKKPKK